MRQNCLTDNILMEKAKDIAASMKLDSFKASKNWITAFKHRHHINVQVFHGEAASADRVGVHVACAMVPELLLQQAITTSLSRTWAKHNGGIDSSIQETLLSAQLDIFLNSQ